MEVNCLFPTTIALPSGIEGAIPVGYEAGWAPELFRMLWRRKTPSALAENRTPFPLPASSYVSHYTEWPILAMEDISL